MPAVTWDIRRTGRAWHGDEARARFELTPEKFEMAGGRLFWSETERLVLLALLLENIGADAAVRWATRRSGEKRSEIWLNGHRW